MGNGEDDKVTIEIICNTDNSGTMQISSDRPAFDTFPVKSKKSELIAQIICHDVKRLLAMDKLALMRVHLGIIDNDTS